MTFMPRGQSRSVPDAVGEAYDAMLRRVRTVRSVESGARRVGRDPPGDAFLQNPVFEAGEGPEPAHRLVFRPDEEAIRPIRIGGPAKPRPDPYRTEVFKPGADGKLHPVEGWTTTGPFDFSRWAANIDWPRGARSTAGLVADVLAAGGAFGRSSRASTAGVVGAGATKADRATLSGGVYAAGNNALNKAEAKPRPPAARPDPRLTEVFKPGPDGKLHPVEGWTTTEPFDVEQWLDNIDWWGVGRDLARITAGSFAGLGAPGLSSKMGAAGVTGAGVTAADGLALGGGVYLAGDAALEDLQPTKRPELK